MKIHEISEKPVRRIVGLMSGTSADGTDAALIELSGSWDNPQVHLLSFENLPYPPQVREQIFELFRPDTSTVDKIGYMNFLLGEIYSESVLSVISKAGLAPDQVDLIGSHGQTIWHEPDLTVRDGYPIRYTVQIGEGAVIASRTGIPTVSDFRVADMALGGQGAPLVPFPEYLLYRQETKTILLQNIGGIGNMTVLPAASGPDQVYAFDTGPGNMIIDGMASELSGGSLSFDDNGSWAAQGTPCYELLNLLQQEPYYSRPLPKTTGRELFGEQYISRIMDWQKTHRLSPADLIATVTDLTAWSIADAYERYVLPRYTADTLIVGGGGSCNKTLLAFLQRRFAQYGVQVITQEDLGWNSDAKEAVAFAIMADRFAAGLPNVLPGVTGAKAAAVMGKLSLPPLNVHDRT